MDGDKRRRSLSRHSSRASRSVTPPRSRRHRRRSSSRSRSRSRSVEERRHRKRSVSRSRSRSRDRDRDRDRHSRRHYRSSKKHHSSKSRNKSERTSKQDDYKNYEKEKSTTTNKINNYNDDSDNSSTNNYPNANECYNNDDDEPIDKERIHREIEQKLRETLAREGKVYPPKKPEASHPVFANDGSFLEIFKKMQEQQSAIAPFVANTNPIIPPQVMSASPTTAAYVAASATGRSAPPPPIVGMRRGGKILKTGMVAKQRVNADGTNTDPKDFWSLYLAEVNKYKNTACESETGNRPLVK